VSSLPSGFTLLQVVPALDAGGVEQTTLDVSRAVVAAGGRSLVASAGGRLEDELARTGGVLVRMPLDRKTPAALIAAGVRLRALIDAERVSLVHARSRAPAYPAFLAARGANVPLVTTYHGVYNARSGLKRWYNRIMTRGVVTIANSEFTRTHVLAEHHPREDRVVAIPRGVDLNRFDPAAVGAERIGAMRARFGLAPGDPRLVLILAARLTRWKGQLLMIDALQRLEAAGLRGAVRLVLAGDAQGRTGYLGEIEGRIAAHGLGEAVLITGHLEDMPAAYLAADAAVAPSIEPEAFGRSAVEPQIMGRPVLAADHGAVRETVVDGVTGFRLTPGDAEAWSLGVRRLLALGPGGRAAMGAAAAARARRLYSVEAMCEKTLEVYVRALREGRA
jgi:glycosyltransferase involved in cell wall biosynthesis